MLERGTQDLDTLSAACNSVWSVPPALAAARSARISFS